MNEAAILFELLAIKLYEHSGALENWPAATEEKRSAFRDQARQVGAPLDADGGLGNPDGPEVPAPRILSDAIRWVWLADPKERPRWLLAVRNPGFRSGHHEWELIEQSGRLFTFCSDAAMRHDFHLCHAVVPPASPLGGWRCPHCGCDTLAADGGINKEGRAVCAHCGAPAMPARGQIAMVEEA